jgi:hypothetical protein
MNENRKRYILTSLLIVIIFTGLSCNKERYERVPNVFVNFTIDLNQAQYSPLQLTGGWVYVTGGYRGIIIYRKTFEEFVALDRTSTYKPESEGNRVIVEENNLIAADTVSGSRFLLLDGSIVEGPAPFGLKQYRTTFDGINIHITN